MGRRAPSGIVVLLGLPGFFVSGRLRGLGVCGHGWVVPNRGDLSILCPVSIGFGAGPRLVVRSTPTGR
jgi:hypothetical protein